MADFIAGWITNPAFAVGVAVLVGLSMVNVWLNQKFGTRLCVGIAAITLSMLVVVLLVSTASPLGDLRHWVASGIVVGVTAGPALLVPLAIPKDLHRTWQIGVGVACSILGALAYPLVALFTVCELGIDCL
jgi:hypothetical protein